MRQQAIATSQDIYNPSEHDRKYAESQLELARLQAATYLPQLLEVMVDRALDPQAKSKDILDASEFTYKVSGLAKRQEETRNAPTFQVKIVLPGQNREITIGGGSAEPEPVSEEAAVLDQVPAHVKTMKRKRPKNTDDLVFSQDDTQALPDFSLGLNQKPLDAIDLEFGEAINNLNFDDID